MSKSTFSVLIGILGAAVIAAGIFAGVSLFNPGWLSTAFARQPARPSVVVVEPNNGNGPNGNANPGVFATVPPPAVVWSTPLPTAENGVCGGPEQMTIALLGVDDREGDYSKPTRTDAIKLLNVRFTDKSAALFSIPRDLYMPQPNLEAVGITQDRINTAYLYGEVYGVPGGGPEQLKQTIELNFGLHVHRYVLVNFGAFVKFVDALGGVDVNVPKAISDPLFPLPDDSGVFLFEVPAGLVHMDGITALRYARTRHQDDDYHRIVRQQDVMLAVRDKLLSPAVIPQIPALLGTLDGLVRTDLTTEEIASLACVGPQIDRAAIESYAITGEYVIPWTTPTGGRVSIPNRDAIGPLVSGFLGE